MYACKIAARKSDSMLTGTTDTLEGSELIQWDKISETRQNFPGTWPIVKSKSNIYSSK